MIKEELKKFPPGNIGGEIEFRDSGKGKRNPRLVFYFEENSWLMLTTVTTTLKKRGLTFKDWYDYHYLPRDENGEYIFPKCKYCGGIAMWNGKFYNSYCEDHRLLESHNIKSESAKRRIEVYGPNRMTKELYVRKYGEEDGSRKWESYCESKANTLDKYIKKYGIEEGTRRYEENCRKNSESHTLRGYIKKYGKEEGERRYSEAVGNISKSKSLDGLIDKYGEEEGSLRYKKLCERNKESSQLSHYVDLYGEEEGLKKYFNSMSNLKKSEHSTSPISVSLFDFIMDRLQFILKDDDVFYGEDEWIIYGTRKYGDFKKYRIPDFLIKSKKIIIEFQGDYWHKRPNSSEFQLSELTDWMEECIENDYHKLKVYRALGYQVFYAHECEYRENPDLVIEECIKFITNKEYRDEYTNMLDQVI